MIASLLCPFPNHYMGLNDFGGTRFGEGDLDEGEDA